MDIASQKDKRGIYLDQVGITALKMPIKVKDRSQHRDAQCTIGTFNAFVDLHHDVRGTHMSRIVQQLYEHKDDISQSGLEQLTADLISKLGAERSKVEVEFPYFTEAYSPVTGLENLMTHLAWFEAERTPDYDFRLGISVDIMTVCPCAKEECGNGNSHVQRGKICIYAKPKPNKWVWLEDLIEIAQASGSQPVYDRLKRMDEKEVVVEGFKNAKFVEDVCRDAVLWLKARDDIDAYRVQVENFESIHTHNAWAKAVYKWY